jgi:streptogramin lyase
MLDTPQDIYVDKVGKMFIADTRNNVIRMVDTSGIISTVAGIGSFGYSGDGGLATKAQLGSPTGVCVDRNGRIYIGDYSNRVIRMVYVRIITTIAGTGPNSYGYSGDGGLATNAQFQDTGRIHRDQIGRIYIADSRNGVIRMIDGKGIITTVAGNRPAAYGYTGEAGYGYSGDGGPATNALFRRPDSVHVDQDGRLFITDSWNYVIRMVDTFGIITTVAGTPGSRGYSGDGGPATNAQLSDPADVYVDLAGRLFIADSSNDVIRMVDTFGIITTVAGKPIRYNSGDGYKGNGGQAINAELNSPVAIYVDKYGSIFIAEMAVDVIRMVQGKDTFVFS